MNRDVLQIYDWDSKLGFDLGNYSGVQDGVSIRSATDKLILKFSADSSVSGRGFELVWEEDGTIRIFFAPSVLKVVLLYYPRLHFRANVSSHSHQTCFL